MTGTYPAIGARPLSVAVLVELERGPRSGGHVKCWERLAEAATTCREVDLTVYVLGPAGVDVISPNVRFRALPPALSSAGLTRLVGGVDTADLAPFHPRLARLLPSHDLWHLTHAMSFGQTALRTHRLVRRPMVYSLHTDVPVLTRHYTEQVLSALPGPMQRALRAGRLPQRLEELAWRRQASTIRGCDHALVSNPADGREVHARAPAVPISTLRRGVDARFSASPSNRAGDPLAERWGVPTGVPRVLFVGRVDRSKGIDVLVDAIRLLVERGTGVHLVVAGAGSAAEGVRGRLGSSVTLLGHVPQDRLAEVYAGCDLLAFPSRSETAGNVVGEAMAAAVPVVLPRAARTERWLAAPGKDGVLVPDDTASSWAAALEDLIADPERRRRIGTQGRRTLRERHPSWDAVFREDLLPVWMGAARGVREWAAPAPLALPARPGGAA